MGVHGDSNIKRRATRLQKGRLRQRMKKRIKQENRSSFMVNDVNLLSQVTIKHKVRCRNSNVSISGKRRHKQLKRLRHSQKEKSIMDIDDSRHNSVAETKDIPMIEPSKQRQSRTSRQKQKRRSKAKLTTDSANEAAEKAKLTTDSANEMAVKAKLTTDMTDSTTHAAVKDVEMT